MPTRIRALRQERSWTQPQLALRAGISATTIKNIETGEYFPRHSTLLSLACAFDLDVDALDATTPEEADTRSKPPAHPTRIRWVREQRLLSRTALATRSGVSVSEIKRIELAQSYPLPETLKALAAAFDLPESELFTQNAAQQDRRSSSSRSGS